MNTTVIIPTTGTAQLKDAVDSLINQTRTCRILLVIDGPEFTGSVLNKLKGVAWFGENIVLHVLPENVGANGWYGHRVYASIPMLVNTPYVAFLDQDNYFSPDWIEIMENSIESLDADVVTCRRTVIQQDGTVIGKYTRESIGVNKLGYVLYDTNTYLFRQEIAHKICPHIYGQWGADRPFSVAVRKQNHKHLTGYYGTYYRAPERLYQHFQEVCK